jgi:hypothetical protein
MPTASGSSDPCLGPRCWSIYGRIDQLLSVSYWTRRWVNPAVVPEYAPFIPLLYAHFPRTSKHMHVHRFDPHAELFLLPVDFEHHILSSASGSQTIDVPGKTISGSSGGSPVGSWGSVRLDSADHLIDPCGWTRYGIQVALPCSRGTLARGTDMLNSRAIRVSITAQKMRRTSTPAPSRVCAIGYTARNASRISAASTGISSFGSARLRGGFHVRGIR